MRMLHTTLRDPAALSAHPAAAGPRFRLLCLALRVARSAAATTAAAAARAGGGVGGGGGGGKEDARGSGGASVAGADTRCHSGAWQAAALLLRDRAVRAGLAWCAALLALLPLLPLLPLACASV